MNSTETPEAQANPRGSPPPVLVVEDDAIIRMEMCEFLRDAGFNVYEASDGGEALRVLGSSVHLVALITDVKMPGECDGLELAARARASRPDIKIVIVSGDAPDGAARQRSDVFLRKPYNIGRLVEHTRELTGFSQK